MQIIYLIDPNDVNLEKVIAKVNQKKPNNLWIGCSTSLGQDIATVFAKVQVPASLYPGNLEQIQKAENLAEHIYLADPLIYSEDLITKKKKSVFSYIETSPVKEKYKFMHFVVLHPNSSVARMLGVNHKVSNDEVLKKLDSLENLHEYIYLEAGSRNSENPITQRLSLIKKIRENYDFQIICGGGIKEISQLETLKEYCDYAVVSHAIHEHPELIKKYQKLDNI